MSTQPHDLDGRVALVTGGGRGIGRAVALRLAAAGARVAVNYVRDEGSATATLDAIHSLGADGLTVRASVDDAGACAAMVERIDGDLGPISILVHNAGIASRGRSVVDTEPEEVERVVRIHAIGPHALTRLVLPAMRDQPRGDIVMVSSAATHLLTANGAPYNMGKAALEALAHTLAKEEVAHGIHVNIVAPGLVASDMGDRLAKAVTGGKVDRASALDASSPFGHVCRPEEVADVVAFLVSAEAGYLTGQRIVVDGGANPHRA